VLAFLKRRWILLLCLFALPVASSFNWQRITYSGPPEEVVSRHFGMHQNVFFHSFKPLQVPSEREEILSEFSFWGLAYRMTATAGGFSISLWLPFWIVVVLISILEYARKFREKHAPLPRSMYGFDE
jgi:hypothetical protein